MNPPTANQPRPDDSVPRFPLGKIFKDVLFDTWWVAPLLWFCSIAFALWVFELSFNDPFGVLPLVLVAALSILATTILFVIAFVIALCKRRSQHVALHVLIVIVTLVGACDSARRIETPSSGERAWHSTPAGVPFPFAVEYRLVDPFLGDYHKRIVFPSGQRIGLASGESSHMPLAIYALDSGRYAVVHENRGSFPPFYIYRVDPETQTVDSFTDGLWRPLSPDPVGGVSCGSRAPLVQTKTGGGGVRRSVPVGDELAHRHYLGLVHKTGEFEPGGPQDPLAALLDPLCPATPPAPAP